MRFQHGSAWDEWVRGKLASLDECDSEEVYMLPVAHTDVGLAPRNTAAERKRKHGRGGEPSLGGTGEAAASCSACGFAGFKNRLAFTERRSQDLGQGRSQLAGNYRNSWSACEQRHGRRDLFSPGNGLHRESRTKTRPPGNTRYTEVCDTWYWDFWF